MGSLYESYLEMIGEVEAYNIKMSGTDVKPRTGALVITKESLDKFARKLREIENKKTEAEKEKERLINYALDMLRRSDNSYNVPEQSSGSDDAAFYFPFGRD